jgi:hypothetical protein
MALQSIVVWNSLGLKCSFRPDIARQWMLLTANENYLRQYTLVIQAVSRQRPRAKRGSR